MRLAEKLACLWKIVRLIHRRDEVCLFFCVCHWCNKQYGLSCILLHRGAPEADVLSTQTQILSANNSNTKKELQTGQGGAVLIPRIKQRRRSPPADFWIRTHSEALTTLLFITKKHVSIIPRNGNNVGQMLRLNQSWKHRYALKVQFQTLDIPVREWVYFVSDSGWIQCNIHDKLPRVCCLFFSECSFSKPETSLYQAKCIFWHHLQ